MPKCIHVFRSSAAAVALAAAFLGQPATASDANLKSMSLSTEGGNTTLHVISTDKHKWDQLKTGGLQFSAHMKVDTRSRGYVEDVALVLGTCGGNSCNAFPALWSATVQERDYENQQEIGFHTSKIPVASGGIPVLNDRQEIIDRCNQHLAADGPTKSYSFTHTFSATLLAGTDTATFEDNFESEANGPWPSLPSEIDYWRSDTFDVQVICDPVVKPAADSFANDFGDFDVENVKLFLTTYQNNQPGSNPGTVCPSLKVTSRAEANQAGAVTMRVWRQKDGGPITSEVTQAWASFNAAKNGYFATVESWEDVGATAHFQYLTEIVSDSAFAPSDGWKDITVHCTSAGGGGFAPEPQDDPDQPKPQAKWQGDVIVADSAGRDLSCPRKAQVSFAVTRAAPGDFNYRIGCSNGAFFTGTATGYDQGGGVYRAVGAHDLSVNRTRSIQCTLQELQPGPVTVDVDSEDFTCNNPAIDPAADDITSGMPTFEEEPGPKLPPVVVDPGRKCLPNQRLIRGKCVEKPVVAACRNTEKLVNGKCIGVSIHCLPGFKQVGLKCVRQPVIADKCKAGEIRVRGKCVVKPDVSIFCKKGFMQVGKTCVRKPVIAEPCKPNQIKVRGVCVKKPEVSILCKKGFRLVGKSCVRNAVVTKRCSSGETLVRGNCVGKPPVKKQVLQKLRPIQRKPVLPTAKTLRRSN